MRTIIGAGALFLVLSSSACSAYSIAPNVPAGSTNAMNVRVTPGLTPVISWDGGPASVVGVSAADDADCKRPNGCWQLIGTKGGAIIDSPVTYGITPTATTDHDQSDATGVPLIKGHYYFIIVEGVSSDKSVLQWAP